MKISVKEASSLLGIREQALRIALQQNRFPFGTAIETKPGRFMYYINARSIQLAWDQRAGATDCTTTKSLSVWDSD